MKIGQIVDCESLGMVRIARINKNKTVRVQFENARTGESQQITVPANYLTMRNVLVLK